MSGRTAAVMSHPVTESTHGGLSATRRKAMSRLRVFATQLVLLGIFGAIWQVAASQDWINSFFFGTPLEIVSTLKEWALDGTLLFNTATTLYEAAVGFVVAVIVAVPTGIALARSPFWGRVFHPFIDLANSTPRFALAPLFVLFFGLTPMTKIVLVFSVVYFVMLISTISGTNAVDKNYIRFAQLVGVSRRQLYAKVILPATTQWLVAGMRISAPYAIAAAVVGEMISSNKGLGFLIVRYSGLLETSKVLAAVMTLAVAGWALNICLTWLFKRLPWVA
jgi:NitT/TauT family transport system permease protein